MWTSIGQYVGGKVLTALLVLGCVGGGIWFYNNPEQLEAIWTVIKYVLAWLALVIVLPWAGFPIQRWLVRQDSNAASGLVLAGYTAADALVAIFLAGGISGHNFLTWVVFIVGFLAAGVYNFLVCDYQVTRFEEG